MPDIATIFGRHEFAVRRLHSLLGLVPVGAFLCVSFGHQRQHPRRAGNVSSCGSIRSTTSAPITLVGSSNGLHLPAHPAARADRPDHRGPRQAERCCITSMRETSATPLQRWTGVIAFAFIAVARLPDPRLVPRAGGSAHVTRPLGGGTFDPATPPPRPLPAIQGAIVAVGITYVGDSGSVYTILPTACGPWASPGAFGPVPAPSAGPACPALPSASPWL